MIAKLWILISGLVHSTQLFSDDAKTYLVVSAVGFAQGLINSSDVVVRYIFKDDYALSPTQSSFFKTTNMIPFMIKPVWGSISDNFNLFGYRRKSYILVMAFLGWICLANFGLWVPPIILGFILLLCSNISLAFTSCMAQAVLVQNAQEKTRRSDMGEEEKTKAASQGVSTFLSARYTGNIIGSALVMFLFIETNRQEYMFATSFVPLILFMIGFLLPERRIKPTNSLSTNDHPLDSAEIRLCNSPKILSNGLGETEKSESSNFQKTITFVKNPLIMKSILLMFLSSFVIQCPQVKFYYYTNYLNFDASFISSLDFLTTSAILLAIMVYNRYLHNIEIKKFYAGTLWMCCIFCLSQLILVFRWNVALGIPDKLFAALDSFILEMVLEFNTLPVLVLACKICPKNIEATIFALLMSVCNAGYLLSTQLGTLVSYLLGITSDNFDNLWILTLITSLCNLIPLTVLWTIKLDSTIQDDDRTEMRREPEAHTIVTPFNSHSHETLNELVSLAKIEEQDPQLLAIKEDLYSKITADEKLNAFS